MRNSQLVLTICFSLLSLPAFAHGDHGACAAYEEKCKTDATVTAAKDKAHWEAMKTCIAAAAKADAANGQKCLDMQAAHSHGGAPASGAMPAAAPAAAPAAGK